MPTQHNRGLLAVILEVTKGTVVPPLAADVVQISDPRWQDTITSIPRNDHRTSHSRPSAGVGTRLATCTFRAVWKGSGTNDTPPGFAALLRACGLGETINPATDVDYDPVTPLASQETVTLDLYWEGERFRMAGAMGNAKFIVGENEEPAIEFTMVGVYVARTTASELTGFSFFSTNPPNPVSMIATWNGINLRATTFELDMGNDVQQVRTVTAAQGADFSFIADRLPIITCDPEIEVVATADWIAEKISQTEAAFSVQLGSVAGNTHILSAPKAQITDAQPGDRDGVLISNVKFDCNADTDAGDDEMKYKHQ